MIMSRDSKGLMEKGMHNEIWWLMFFLITQLEKGNAIENSDIRVQQQAL
jgi:hypothetical protein